MRQRFRNSFYIIPLGFVVISMIVGCPDKNVETDGRPEYWRAVEPGSELVLLVVGDAEVAKKIRQAVGTWEELTQASLVVEETTIEELLASGQKPKADAVIAPIELQATLVQFGYPTRITTAMYNEGGEPWQDLLETYRTKLSKFGPDITFVPFGSQFFVCYYRADLLQQIKESPPANWADFERLRGKLQERHSGEALEQDQGQGNWFGSLEPTAPGWAAQSFLTRAAAYTTHRDNYSTLFDIRTMSALVATEPFVRALREMQTANPPGTPRYSPHEVRRAFWQSETALAVTFPTAAGPTELVTVKSSVPDFKAGIVQIPGSMQVFNSEKKIWDDRRPEETPHIPTLISGHVGMVSAETDAQVAMFKLLLWLSSREWGTDVFSSSSKSGIGRKSEIEQVSRWVEREMTSEQMMQYVSVLSKHWNAGEVFVMPPIPGHAEYMAALDREVLQVLDGHKTPQEALDEVVRQWDAVTEKYGVESQRNLYRQSCGLVGN